MSITELEKRLTAVEQTRSTQASAAPVVASHPIHALEAIPNFKNDEAFRKPCGSGARARFAESQSAKIKAPCK